MGLGLGLITRFYKHLSGFGNLTGVWLQKTDSPHRHHERLRPSVGTEKKPATVGVYGIMRTES